jgi:Ribosomal protein S24e
MLFFTKCGLVSSLLFLQPPLHCFVEALLTGLWLLLQTEIQEKLAKMYSVRDPQQIFVFGFRTQVKRTWVHAMLQNLHC